MSELQSKHYSVVAVHTDSIISTERLPYSTKGVMGDLIFECEGNGVILGSGVYQIGDKVRFRGFDLNLDLMQIVGTNRKFYKVDTTRPLTWREVAFHGWEHDRINRFEIVKKKLAVDFDQKRLWIKDWKSFKDVEKRKVISVPLIVDQILGYK